MKTITTSTAALLAALTLALAGCGGGDDEDDTGLVWVQLANGLWTQCPKDPATFVGPILVECLQVGGGR